MTLHVTIADTGEKAIEHAEQQGLRLYYPRLYVAGYFRHRSCEQGSRN